ncbi:MAG: hypothetical protein ACKOTZ_05305 [Chloroflexota bacterium]
MRHTRSITALAALLVVAGLPAPVAHAQGGTIVDFRRGTVIADARGEPDEVAITAEELEEATRRVELRLAGIVVAGVDDPAASAADAREAAAVAERLAAARMEVVTCTTAPDRTAGDCVRMFDDDDALAIVIAGDLGDLTAETQRALDDRTIVVGIGNGLTLAPGAVALITDPLLQARAQGRAAGVALDPLPDGRTGAGILFTGLPPNESDPVADANLAGLAEAAPRVRIPSRLGPPAIHDGAELAAVVASSPKTRLVLGEGLLLDAITQEALAALPEDLRIVPWSCEGGVGALVGPRSRIRACMARADGIAGEAAANALLAIMTSRDIPGTIVIPVDTARGTIAVGPGRVALGRTVSGDRVTITDAERAAGLAALSGGAIGLIAGRDTTLGALHRAGLIAALEGSGVAIEPCDAAGQKGVRACIGRLVERGVSAIVTLGTDVAMPEETAAAVAAGVPVVGLERPHEGDTGEVSVSVDPRSLALLVGRRAGAWSEAAWPEQPVEVLIADASGAGREDPVSTAIASALIRRNPLAMVVGRVRVTDERSANAAARAVEQRFPGVRVVVGSGAGLLDAPLRRRTAIQPGLGIFPLACDATIRETIDARAMNGTLIKGCADPDPEGAGRLAGTVLLRLLAGGEVREIVDAPVRPYGA